MAYFQFVVAAITIVLIAGAYLGRLNFLACMIFVPLWITLCYTVWSIWVGGFPFQMGVIGRVFHPMSKGL